MPKTLKWARTAYNSYLNVLEGLILSDSNVTAQKVEIALANKIKRLKIYPKIGVLLRKRKIRKLVLLKSYFVVYASYEKHITILAFIDSRTNHKF